MTMSNELTREQARAMERAAGIAPEDSGVPDDQPTEKQLAVEAEMRTLNATAEKVLHRERVKIANDVLAQLIQFCRDEQATLSYSDTARSAHSAYEVAIIKARELQG